MWTYNCCWTVWDRCESSTTESSGTSDVNSSSKFDVSIAEAYGRGQYWPSYISCRNFIAVKRATPLGETKLSR